MSNPVATMSYKGLSLRIERVHGHRYRVVNVETGEHVTGPGTWSDSLAAMIDMHLPLIKKETSNVRR